MASIFLILFAIWMVKSPRDRRNSEWMKNLLKGFIGMAIGLPLLFELFPALAGLVMLVGLGFGCRYLMKLEKEKRQDEERARRNGWNRQTTGNFYTGNAYTGTARQTAGSTYAGANRQTAANTAAGSYTESKTVTQKLPKTVKKRKNIINSFNEKYRLYLTEDQIASIVNSSYMSEIWSRELEAMSRRYETVYEWFQGQTSWLRVYMYVFHVQEITSDIRQQEQICMYSFETIFQYVDSLGDIPQANRISMVNEKFFASFDDISFMIAYRFLESRGLHHDLKGPELARNVDSAEDLVNKYAGMNKEDSDEGLRATL